MIDRALTLYALLKADSTPAWAKAAIIAALGYFICPIDAVPDFLPVGFVDDVTVMSAVLANLSRYMNGEVKTEVERSDLSFPEQKKKQNREH